jgi:hypothetical protein
MVEVYAILLFISNFLCCLNLKNKINGIREFVKNNLPIFTILFPLFCVEFLLNNSLFLKKLVLTKENIITNIGKLFFTNSLN